jgi:hypothetical protein
VTWKNAPDVRNNFLVVDAHLSERLSMAERLNKGIPYRATYYGLWK